MEPLGWPPGQHTEFQRSQEANAEPQAYQEGQGDSRSAVNTIPTLPPPWPCDPAQMS